MDMPIKRFWLMNQNIDRVQAQFDVRTLTLLSAAQSHDIAQEVRAGLIKEIGTVVVDKPIRDTEGFEDLKTMMFTNR